MLARTATATRPNRLGAFHESARSLRVLKWIVLPLVIAHVLLATISGYRAIVQVYRVEIAVDAGTFQPGNALLRATANGRSQWLRVPPPVIEKRAVDIEVK